MRLKHKSYILNHFPDHSMYLSAQGREEYQGWIGLYVGTCSHVCPQSLLNEARTNIGLSPTMGFLNEDSNLAYFANFRRIVRVDK